MTLVDRLRDWRYWLTGTDGKMKTPLEAADRIEALEAEVAALRGGISQFHHAMKDAGWHPGRTDDNLCDIIRGKGQELAALRKDAVFERASRRMLFARLENIADSGDKLLSASSVLSLLNDCDFLSAIERDVAPQPERVPLTDEQCFRLWKNSPFRGNGGQADWFAEGIRAAERAHGIGATIDAAIQQHAG